MYDEEMRLEALDLLDSGLTARQVSRRLGGKPSAHAIATWAQARSKGRIGRKKTVRVGASEKLAALERVANGEHPGDVAGSLDVSEATVRYWMRLARTSGEASILTGEDMRAGAAAGSPEGLPDDPDELKRMVLELQFQVDLSRELLEIVKKDPGADAGSLTNREKTALIGALRPAYSLTFLTARLGIAPSTYHYNRARMLEARDPDGDIRQDVIRLFDSSGGADGYRRIWSGLAAARDGRGPSEKRVRRVMRAEGLRVVYDRKRRRRYDSYDPDVARADADRLPNVPLREDGSHAFSAPAPNVLWVSDVTEFVLPDDARHVYLSPILDCYDSSLVSWEIGLDATSRGLTDPCLESACAKLGPGDAPTLHTDGGAQYRARTWKRTCEANNITRSMSRPGHSPDNARMEGFFGTLKNAFFYYRDWSGWSAERFMAELQRRLVWYNEVRRKQSLGWMTPMEYRRAALQRAA